MTEPRVKKRICRCGCGQELSGGVSLPTTTRQKQQEIASLGILLAERLTRYFSPADEIDEYLECDVEIRRMADHLLARTKVVGPAHD